VRDGRSLFDSQGSIRLKDVESALRGLWRSAAEQSPEGVRLSRVVLLNIIAVCSSEDAATRTAQCLGGVASDHPSRSILIWNCGSDPAASLDVRVSVACQLMGRTGHQVCCEQVFVDARGAPLEKVAGAVLPLTLPDVPLALWLPDGVNVCSEELRRFVSVSDRLLVDTRLQRDAASCFRRILEWHEKGSPVVVDLAWLQLARCRQAVAQQFDPPRWREKLSDVRRVEIAYDDAAPASPPADALLMAGWIAARLHWRDLTPSPSGLAFSAAGDRELVILSEKGHGCGRVRRVSFETAGGWVFLIQFEESHVEATLTVLEGGAEISRDTIHIPDLSDAELLCGALEVSRRDAVYAEACSVAAELAVLRG
jgi:glucose-6-phosphate dehydrogenase assembly protein OpcA